MREELKSKHLGDAIEKTWQKDVAKSRRPSLLKYLFKIFGPKYMLVGILLVVEEATVIVQPLILSGLVRYFTDESTVTKTDSYLYAAGVSLCAIVLLITHHSFYLFVQTIGVQIRTACCSFMYRKLLRLSHEGLGKTTSGQIINLMTNDVKSFDLIVTVLHYLWIGPCSILVIGGILWYELGPAALTGFVMMFLITPILRQMGTLTSKYRLRSSKSKDERILLMKELISGIRVIKMYCWETAFADFITKVRRKELSAQRKLFGTKVVHMTLAFVSKSLFLLPVLVVMLFTSTNIRVTSIFVAIRLYDYAGSTVLRRMMLAYRYIIQTRISINRIETFLKLDEVKHSERRHVHLEEVRNSKHSEEQHEELRRTHSEVHFEELRDGEHNKAYFKELADSEHSDVQLKELADSEHSEVRLEETGAREHTDIQLEELRHGEHNMVQFEELTESEHNKVKFAKLIDSKHSKGKRNITKKDKDEPSIVMENASAKWTQASKHNTIQNITVTLKTGKLLAVVGPVGAGKSSFLMALLKELPLTEGRTEARGRLAYVSQQPWVFSETLRQNILFGNKFDKVKFDRILKACALEKDIAKLPHGDMTLLGDRGVNLSGGQKARVSLARSLYINGDVFLLDDPLSSVDSYVGRHIFENVIQGLLKDKSRILVTHQIHFLKKADLILFLKEGKVFFHGSYEEYRKSGAILSSLQTHYQEEERDHESKDKQKIEMNQVIQTHKFPDQDDSSSSESTTSSSTHSSMWSLASIGNEYEPDDTQVPEKEEMSTGLVGVKVYCQYFAAGTGVVGMFVLMVLFLMTQGTFVMSDWWLAFWASEEEEKYVAMKIDNKNATNIDVHEVDTTFNILVYSGIVAAFILICLLRTFMFYKVAVDIADNLHSKILTCVIRSPIGFFDRNEATGRILNRFSNDVRQLDDMLPSTFIDLLECALLTLGGVIVAGVVSPWIYTAVIPLMFLFVKLRMGYIRMANDIARLRASTQSPVQSHILASTEGISCVRAFRAQDKMIEKYDTLEDLHVEAKISFLKKSRWFSAKLDTICAVFVITVCVLCVVVSEDLDASLVGLSLTYAISTSYLFQWFVRRSAEVENQMVSVERLLEYTKLSPEGPHGNMEGVVVESNWPQKGDISIKNASLRYSDNAECVLKNITFTIAATEKVGIVGRTGAGKSSLIAMLFRLVEPEGNITIDGVDIQTIGLSTLRERISIIPQEPVLFTGTVAQNLDPFGCYGDEDLWLALEEVQLKQVVKNLPQGLQSEVTEGGNNFSVGQRQLLCLARAILRKNKILIVDEATANVDNRTDELIQQTVRRKFSHCTVLTIAHRLQTVMDSDKILVLDEGMIQEYDAPYILLQKPDGYLRKLVEQTGRVSTLHLTEVAEQDFVGHNVSTKNAEWKATHVHSAMEGDNVEDVNKAYDGTYL